jgi:hypothetical protein
VAVKHPQRRLGGEALGRRMTVAGGEELSGCRGEDLGREGAAGLPGAVRLLGGHSLQGSPLQITSPSSTQ